MRATEAPLHDLRRWAGPYLRTSAEPAIVVWAVGAEPSSLASPTPLASGNVYSLRLQTFGDGALALWSTNPGVAYAWLDAGGNLVEMLEPPLDSLVFPELAPNGDGVSALFTSRADGANTGLALAAIDENGASRGAPLQITTSDHVYGPLDVTTTPNGDHVVASVAMDLTGLYQLYWARVTPSW